MATAGFVATQELRKQIDDLTAKHQAKVKAANDARYDAKGRSEAATVLAAWPAEMPVSTAALAEKLKAEKAKETGRENMAGLNSLLKRVEKGDAGAEDLKKQIAAEIVKHADDADKLDAEAAELKEKLDKLTATYKGYQDLVTRGELPKLKNALGEKAEAQRVTQFRKQEELDFLAPFEKDRTGAAPRLIEQDLAKLRAVLQNIPEGPPEDVARCDAKKELQKFVEELQEDVDHVAHVAQCHICKDLDPDTPNKGVDRTSRAKELINAKVQELQDLADGKKPPADTPQGRADKALADALKRMQDETDENGKTAGKMLGVLVCEDNDGKEVLIYGYSGTLGVSSRMAEKEKFETDIQIDPAGKLVENGVKQNAADAEIGLKEADLKKTPEHTTAEEARKKLIEKEARKKEIDALLKPNKSSKAPALTEIEKKKLETELAETTKAIEDTKAALTDAQAAAAATVEGRRLKKAKDDKLELERYAKRLADEKKKQDDRLKPPEALKDKPEEAAAYVEAQKEKAAAEQEALKKKLEEAKAKVAQASLDDSKLEDSTAARWVRSLNEKGDIQSVGGDSVSLPALNKDHFDTPHGVCSAPKMVQSALARANAEGLKIKGMAEAWFGGGPNTHGELVASCNTCMKNIGFQFCEVADHG
jgi:hypothetical protein